jgi:hypothetical protein
MPATAGTTTKVMSTTVEKPGTEWTTGTAVTVDVPGTLLKSNSRRNAGSSRDDGNRRDASKSRDAWNITDKHQQLERYTVIRFL